MLKVELLVTIKGGPIVVGQNYTKFAIILTIVYYYLNYIYIHWVQCLNRIKLLYRYTITDMLYYLLQGQLMTHKIFHAYIYIKYSPPSG